MRALFVFITLLFSLAYAKEVPFTAEDREMLRNIYVRLEKLETKMEVGFQQIEKRFEQIDKRFEHIDKRFEQVDKKIDMSLTFIGILAGVFAGITAVTISFAIWDRRSMIRPFEDKTKEIEKRLEKGEDMDRKFLDALRTLAQKDKELAELLKRYNML